MTIIRITKDGHITGPKTKGIEQEPDTISLSGVPIHLPDIKAKEIGKGNPMAAMRLPASSWVGSGRCLASRTLLSMSGASIYIHFLKSFSPNILFLALVS